MTRRVLGVTAILAVVWGLPVFAQPQAGSIDVFGGGGGGEMGDGRSISRSGIVGVTRWWSDRWGIGGWYSYHVRSLRGAVWHEFTPSIRWAMGTEEPVSLHVGIRPLLCTNDEDLAWPCVPIPTADVFLGYALSPSVRIEAGGFYNLASFLPALGLTWTLP